MDGKERARFEEALPGVYPAVLARAAMLVKRCRWFVERYGSVAEAAEELAQDAVLRTMTGKRTWDPAKVPDLDYFLGEVMRSILSAAKKSPAFATDRLSTVAVMDEDERTLSADGGLGLLDDRARGITDPERHLLDAESYAELIEAALDAAGDDADVVKVVEAATAGCVKPDEFVEETGLSKDRVYAATRKIRVRYRKGGRR